jgi:hypothetical protein
VSQTSYAIVERLSSTQKWMGWLCSDKTLFTKPDGGPDLTSITLLISSQPGLFSSKSKIHYLFINISVNISKR